MKKLVFCACLAFTSQLAIAANWVFSPVSSYEGKEKTYIDHSNIQGYYFNGYSKDKYYVMAWVKKEYPGAQKLRDGRVYQESKELWYVDCSAKRFSIGDMVYYTKNGNKVVWSGAGYVLTYSSDSWMRAIPDTVGDGIVQSICLAYQVQSITNQTS